MDLLETAKKDYFEAVFDTNRDRAFSVVDNALTKGISPEEIIFNVVVPSIEMMTAAIVDGQGATLSQHYICSIVSGEVTDKLLPMFSKSEEKRGIVVIGTAQGDFHGLGKKIVSGCLKANLFEVVDLGINVNPDRFVEEALKFNAGVIGVSSMMVHSARGEKGALGVRKILDEKGLSGKIKLVVGGAPFCFDPDLYKEVKADGWALNGLESVKMISGLLGQR